MRRGVGAWRCSVRAGVAVGTNLTQSKKCGDQKVHFAEGQTTARGADTASAMDFRSDSELVRR